MRVVGCMLVLVLLCLSGSGCSLFKKDKNNGNAPNGTTPPAKFPADPLLPNSPPPAFPPLPAQTSAAKTPTTILAGYLFDPNMRQAGNVYIRLVDLNAKDKDAGAPVDVLANGTFTIEKIKPGGQYKLIARSRLGDKMIAGTALARGGETKVVIIMREDLVTADTPPIPGSPEYAKPAEPGKNNAGLTPDTPWNTANNATKPVTKAPIPVSEPNLPATMNVPVPPGNPTYVPNIADNQKDKLPLLNMGPNKKPTAIPPLSLPNDPPRPPALTSPGDAKLNTGPARVPSCVMLGDRLDNMALRDTKGQVWEYQKQGRGKLILLDFWGTYCMPCRETMPALNRLHTLYGPRGLEVIGIALEAGKDERADADNINKLCSSMQVQYRQLLGRSDKFDVGKSFQVQSVPTLILLNESGQVLMVHVGRPDSGKLGELERQIQFRLNHRAF
jgi:thiol-disulfide isomerase/thioredoxin